LLHDVFGLALVEDKAAGQGGHPPGVLEEVFGGKVFGHGGFGGWLGILLSAFTG